MEGPGEGAPVAARRQELGHGDEEGGGEWSPASNRPTLAKNKIMLYIAINKCFSALTLYCLDYFFGVFQDIA